MWKRLIHKLADRIGILSDEYLKGWADGVNQQLHEPETAEHGHLSRAQYWGDEY
jgi:hypothetical protein